MMSVLWCLLLTRSYKTFDILIARWTSFKCHHLVSSSISSSRSFCDCSRYLAWRKVSKNSQLGGSPEFLRAEDGFLLAQIHSTNSTNSVVYHIHASELLSAKLFKFFHQLCLAVHITQRKPWGFLLLYHETKHHRNPHNPLRNITGKKRKPLRSTRLNGPTSMPHAQHSSGGLCLPQPAWLVRPQQVTLWRGSTPPRVKRSFLKKVLHLFLQKDMHTGAKRDGERCIWEALCVHF